MDEAPAQSAKVYERPTAEELRVYLELDAFNEDQKVRANLLIEQAEDLVQDVVRPLPRSARTVVTSAAARAFVNPSDSSSQAAGPFQLNASTGGLYLTKGEQRALQRAAGRGAAFTVDPTPVGARYGYGVRPALGGTGTFFEELVYTDHLS